MPFPGAPPYLTPMTAVHMLDARTPVLRGRASTSMQSHVSAGFYAAWKTLRHEILQLLEEAVKEDEGECGRRCRTVWLTPLVLPRGALMGRGIRPSAWGVSSAVAAQVTP